VAIILMEKKVEYYMKNKDNKKRSNMKKLTKKQLIKRCNSLFESNSKFQQDYAKLLEDKIKSENNLDDMTQVKESLQLQNQTLEKRLLATEVELLRKIVSLYEKQPIQQPIVYNYPNSNGVSTTGTTTTTTGTNSTMLTTYGY
jgi:NurA-like 5'-3' nuclease